MHYFIVGLVILAIVYWQFITYNETVKKLKSFRRIFPGENASLILIKDNEETIGLVKGISSEHNNPIWAVIIDSINKYLANNKGAVSDFHLMKDIVDRNCDSKDEEIQAQIPIPLYGGLVGTMSGILIGLGFLVISGDLNTLLSSSEAQNNDANGITTLMSCVALAMISSIFGIILSTAGSLKAKNVKLIVEKEKNIFLSWIQAELLPNLSSDLSGTLVKMTDNLIQFNDIFSDNVSELQKTFSTVNDSYRDLSEILTAINKMKIANIASVNLQVYDKLKNCTDEIGCFSNYLHSVNDYIAHVKALNEKLDSYETRTKAIEDMGIFFRTEVKQIEERKSAISKTVGNIDTTLQDALKRLNENTELHLNEFRKSTVSQNQIFEKAVGFQHETFNGALLRQKDNYISIVEEQYKTLNEKSKEIDKLVTELQNLTSVKNIMNNLERATNEQNHKIDKLADAINELVKIKVGDRPIPKTPKWIKLVTISVGVLISATCLAVLIPLLLEWVANQIN